MIGNTQITNYLQVMSKEWNSSSHLLLYQDTTWSLSQVDKNSLNISITLALPLLLWRGGREPLTINTRILHNLHVELDGDNTRAV
jgi:hypothetical protein